MELLHAKILLASFGRGNLWSNSSDNVLKFLIRTIITDGLPDRSIVFLVVTDDILAEFEGSDVRDSCSQVLHHLRYYRVGLFSCNSLVIQIELVGVDLEYAIFENLTLFWSEDFRLGWLIVLILLGIRLTDLGRWLFLEVFLVLGRLDDRGLFTRGFFAFLFLNWFLLCSFIM